MTTTLTCDCESGEWCGSCLPAPRIELVQAYTVAEIEQLARAYCDDATSAARLDDRLRLSLFIQYLKRQEREAER